MSVMHEEGRTRWAVGQMGRVVVIRLAPGEDILPSLVRIAKAAGIRQAIVIGGAASLTRAHLRNVRRYPAEWPITDEVRVFTKVEGPLELLSLSGNITMLENGEPYIHCHAAISLGTPDGVAYGGHLLPDTLVFSTAELSMVEVTGLEMLRIMDSETKVGEVYPRPM